MDNKIYNDVLQCVKNGATIETAIKKHYKGTKHFYRSITDLQKAELRYYKSLQRKHNPFGCDYLLRLE